ncbi:MAG: hypothetical protein R3286_09990 [Gammaproteobacteria bacterium]|nr:hypothetical protein [Gammaproteobacteria bacterium]
MIANFLTRVGFLRAVMMAVVLVLVCFAPFAGGHAQTSGWPLVTTVLAPVMFVVFTFVLLLDMLMTRVFMSEHEGAERARLAFVLRTEALLLVVLLAAWSPLVWKLLRL